jgi:hypothetical protein
MRVVFTRIPDHQRGHALVTRDDGVVYRLDGGPITAAVPHDLVHLTVEDSLRIADGIWGAIAGGVVFRSMTHVGGRRPPHAAERSAELIRAHRDNLHRAELIGGYIEWLALGTGSGVRDLRLDPAAAEHAVARLRDTAARWAALPVGAEVVCEWPGHRRLTLAVPRRAGATGRRSRPVRVRAPVRPR